MRQIRVGRYRLRGRWVINWRSKPYPYWYARWYGDGTLLGTVQSGPVEVFLSTTRPKR